MNHMTRSRLWAVLALTLAALALAGCFRKSIESTPPNRRPAVSEPPPAPSSPAPQAEAEPTPTLIEETYVVDAPERPNFERVEEDVLAEEPMPAPDAATSQVSAAETDPMEVGEPEARAEAAPEPEERGEPENETLSAEETASDVSTPHTDGLFFVQVGAFSDVENANRALAYLLEAGYQESTLSRSRDGLFRVRAGAFADMNGAREALSALQSTYPNSYVVAP